MPVLEMIEGVKNAFKMVVSKRENFHCVFKDENLNEISSPVF